MTHAFAKYGENNAYKNSNVGWLLLGCVDDLQKDNETEGC